MEAVLSGLEFSESKPRAVVRTATFGAAVQEIPAKQWAAISPVAMGLLSISIGYRRPLKAAEERVFTQGAATAAKA